MIGALVNFPNPRPRTVEQAAVEWAASAPQYETQPGFVRKHFLMGLDGTVTGGFYLWESVEDADRFYSDEWRRRVTEYAGTAPSITYFHVPTVINAKEPVAV